MTASSTPLFGSLLGSDGNLGRISEDSDKISVWIVCDEIMTVLTHLHQHHSCFGHVVIAASTAFSSSLTIKVCNIH